MNRLLSLSFLLLSVALPAGATDVAGSHLLVPIAGRTAGIGGSQWKTDLVVTNAARVGEPETVEIYFIVDGHLSQPVVALLNPLQSAVMVDAIRDAFGREAATGIILISTRTAGAKITARARIYNTGSAAGQYGQTVPAMPLTKLSKEAYLPGLSGIDGNRTNVGIANPGGTKAAVFISIFESSGEFRGGFSTEVRPYGVLQLNDVFSHFQTGPLGDAMIQVRSSDGVYAYASIVRGDSGDADFVIGTGTEIDEAGRIVAPQCESPATLSLAPLPAEGWTILFKPNVDPFVTTAALESKYGFTAKQIFPFGGFFSLGFSAEAIAALRCEPAVRVVEQNGFVPFP
jgi:hypothetical protein